MAGARLKKQNNRKFKGKKLEKHQEKMFECSRCHIRVPGRDLPKNSTCNATAVDFPGLVMEGPDVEGDADAILEIIQDLADFGGPEVGGAAQALLEALQDLAAIGGTDVGAQEAAMAAMQGLLALGEDAE